MPIGLPLESPRWNELEHAYGEPTSTVQLIRELREFIDTQTGNYAGLRIRTLDEFGSNLFHQQSRYTGTIAAVPHFVSLAKDLPRELRNDILYPVSWIHWLGGNGWIEHDGVNNEIATGRLVFDEDLIEWYDAAIVIAGNLAINAIKEGPEQPNDLWGQLNLLKTVTGLTGFAHLANLVHWFEERWLACPNCETELYARYFDCGYVVWEKKNGYTASEIADADKRNVISRDDSSDEVHLRDFATLLQYAASPKMKLAEKWVRSVHGTFTCPICEHAFRLPKDYGPPTLLKSPK